MKALNVTFLALAFSVVNSACLAQVASIPFAQLAQGASRPSTELMASVMVPGNGGSESTSSVGAPAGSFASGFERPPALPISSRTLSMSFFSMQGLHLGMALLDVGLTQHCIADHHCREGNPLMPSSRGGQLSIDFALVGYGAFVSYRMKKHNARLWWLTPATGAVAHVAGAATGFIHR